MKTYPYLFWGYNVIWLGIAGYLLFLVVRLRRMARRLDRVESELNRKASAAGDQESSGS